MPTVIWFGLNLFRLVAVTFMAWALVAQFMSLVDEINSLSTQSSSFASPVSASTSKQALITQWGLAGAMTIPVSTTTPVMGALVSPPTPTRQPLPTTPAAPAALPTTSAFNALQRVTVPVSDLGAEESVRIIKPLVGPMLGDIRARGQHLRRNLRDHGDAEDDRVELMHADIATTVQTTVMETGARADLIAWVVLSRVVIAIILLVGIAAQLGVPEMFLFDHAGWLGPQSTPLALGGLQALSSIEILRNKAKEVNLIPSYALLGVGLVNVLAACLLLYLGRRLPKQPPPPLYFNHAQRLLFWTLEPPCYRQILDPRLPTHLNEPQGERRRERLPKSNAPEIDLEESDDEEEEYKPSGGEASRYVEGSRAMTADEDVARGGYPTFAPGAGIGQPGRNVPAGTLESDSWDGPVRFTREEDAKAALPVISTSASHPKPRRAQPPSLALARRQRSTDSTFDDIQADLAGSPRPPHTLPREPTRPSRQPKQTGRTLDVPQPDLYRATSSASDNSAYSGISRAKVTYRKSIDQASKDLGPHFPLPPHRKRDRPPALAERRPESLLPVSKDGRRAPSAYLARAPPPSARTVASPMSARFKSPPPRSSTVDVPARPVSALPTSAPKTPHTPGTPLSSVSPVSAQIAQAQHGQVTAGHIFDRQISASPELLVDEPPKVDMPDPSATQYTRGRARALSVAGPPAAPRRPAQSSIKRATSIQPGRPARGVRFDMSSVEEIPEPVPTPRTGLRIPGTNFHLNLPAILSPAPSSRRNSVDSFETAGSAGITRSRPLSGASITSMMEKLELDMEADAKRESKPVVLGGAYLDGGKETLK